jgi:hypothetical protein
MTQVVVDADVPDLWAHAFVRSRDNPLLFATGCLGLKMPGAPAAAGDLVLERWQVDALKMIGKAWRNRFTRPARVAIRSGHGCGKSATLSIVILWALLTWGPDTKIPIVANSQDQLRDGLWPEINKWLERLPAELRAQIDWQKERIVVAEYPEEAFAVRRTASKHRPESLQGFHAKHLLAILEEASGIPAETIEAGAGSLSTPGAMMIAVGNPTRGPGSWFYDVFHKLAESWELMRVNSEDVPRARGHIQDIIDTYGRSSNAYRIRVLGEFPTADADTVIPLDLVKAALGRDVRPAHVFPSWGLDIARHGDDRTVLVKRQGNTLIDLPKVWRQLDGNQVAGRIIAEYEATPNVDKPHVICIDVVGVGYSVYDALRRDNSPCRGVVYGINVSEEPSVSDQDRKLRDELWFAGRNWFAQKDCCIPSNLVKGPEDQKLLDMLFMELTTPTFEFSDLGKRVVERKKDMKKRLGFSPDLADAFLMTFARRPVSRPTDRDGRPKWDDDYDEGSLADAWAA